MMFDIGTKIFVRTITFHHVGRIKDIAWDRENGLAGIELEDASWVADSGRWHDALRTGALSEVEPFVGPVWINGAAIVDVTEWQHDLPTQQK